MPWLKNSLQDLVSTGISPQRIVLGLPSFTRVWKQDQNGDIVQNPAYSYSYVETMLTKNHTKMEWNPELGEYYASYQSDSKNVQVWMANSKSLQTYIALGQQYGVAGSAIWSLNMMDAEHWNETFQ